MNPNYPNYQGPPQGGPWYPNQSGVLPAPPPYYSPYGGYMPPQGGPPQGGGGRGFRRNQTSSAQAPNDSNITRSKSATKLMIATAQSATPGQLLAAMREIANLLREKDATLYGQFLQGLPGYKVVDSSKTDSQDRLRKEADPSQDIAVQALVSERKRAWKSSCESDTQVRAHDQILSDLRIKHGANVAADDMFTELGPEKVGNYILGKARKEELLAIAGLARTPSGFTLISIGESESDAGSDAIQETLPVTNMPQGMFYGFPGNFQPYMGYPPMGYMQSPQPQDNSVLLEEIAKLTSRLDSISAKGSATSNDAVTGVTPGRKPPLGESKPDEEETKK